MDLNNTLEKDIIQRPRSTLIHAENRFIAQMHITSNAVVDIQKEFPFEPIPGAGNATKAWAEAQAWIDAREADLGYVRPLRADRPTGTEFAAGILFLLVLIASIVLRINYDCWSCNL